MIVVVDSGVWISALHFGGTPLAALEKALTEDRVAICDQIEQEVARVLSRKLGWEVRRVEESLGIYFQDLIRVPVPGTLHGACRDSKDDFILECALIAGASLIVSGDKDLLALASFQGVRVVSAADYVRGAR